MPHTHAQVETIKRIPDPQEPVPRLAWPTVAVFLVGAGRQRAASETRRTCGRVH
jgi:hypothetical protein